MKTAYVVSGYRTAVGKAPRGKFKFTRPDDLAVEVVKKMISDFPQLCTSRINDVIVGNATPEAEQGLNIGRMISLMGLIPIKGLDDRTVIVPRDCRPLHWLPTRLWLELRIASLRVG